MVESNVPQATLDKIKAQIYADILPTLNAAIAQTVTEALAELPQSTASPPPEPQPTPTGANQDGRPDTSFDYNPSQSVPDAVKPDIGIAQWIWTQEQPYRDAPCGPRAFRKAAVLPLGQVVDSMIIDITCDNHYTLYVNGCAVGNGTYWNVAHRYSIKFPSTDRVVVAVYAGADPNEERQAGLIASAFVWNSANYQGRTFSIRTDASWETSDTAVSRGFQEFRYAPDSSWTRARVQGHYGISPWGPVPKPTTTSAVTGGFSGLDGIDDPPYAPLAVGAPDADGTTAL